MSCGNKSNVYDCNMVSSSKETELEHLLENFWEIEHEPSERVDSFLDNIWDKHFRETYSRDENGRFVVRIPFTRDPSCLGNSAFMARKRFINLERRFQSNPLLKSEYQAFINEYIELGHMEEVHNIDENHFYLPHHCVIKPDSSSTKLRVVFDGSARTDTNVALNDILAVGPVVQNDLFSIILRFRNHAHAISADIEKMFRQVLVHPDDQRYQYIYWRGNTNDLLKTYRLKTVTYGTTSAPFLSTRCLLQLALDAQLSFPSASSSIRNDIYVDDWLCGANTVQDAILLKNQVTSILEGAGMKLRKWCSNSDEILCDVDEGDKEQFLHLDEFDFIKTLGIYWNSSSDNFRIKMSPLTASKVTKRTVISDIARIYDPVGFVSPIVIVGKMFLQRLWALKIEWDEAVPMQLHTEWVAFREGISKLYQLSIPRHIFAGCENPKSIQIHGFADASERAYGAAVYVRSIIADQICVRLLCSKSRVTSLKKVTLPRLELCAAQLLAKLVSKVKSCINFEVEQTFYWTDSTITLQWIKSPSSKWQTFVANRVASIQSLSDQKFWLHIDSKSNPADLISRGLSSSALIDSKLWWYGPTILTSSEQSWVRNLAIDVGTDDPPEMRKTIDCFVTTTTDDDVLSRIKFSNDFIKIRRTIAFALRFASNSKPNAIKNLSHVFSKAEWDASLRAIIVSVQRVSFPLEITGLRKGDYISNNTALKSLSLFLDDDSIIRVGGRLTKSNLNFDAKYPVLLPENHFMTKTIISFLHSQMLHIGPQGLLAAVRQSYWPINARKLVNIVCKTCVICKRARPKPLVQKMADLPAERVNAAPPFYNVGVDYGGPFYVHYQIRGKVPTKTYLVVFVCFATKATHLELASDLSSAAFLGALKRFIATRGMCKRIVSDNGTNFVGANTELRELYLLLNNKQLQYDVTNLCQSNEIEWDFAPPGSPHFGGLYEAAIKSAKYHLRRMMGKANLTYEELNTLVKQVEAVLNSRPLIPVPSSDNDLQVLTPGHFLIGRPLTAIIEPCHEERVTYLKRWRLQQLLHKQFWDRWSSEYLSQLQNRYFWNKKSKNIPTGTIVLIKDDNQPPLHWKLGRIEEVFPGSDGIVRVVTVRTSNGILRRAITKICPLPVNFEHGCVQGGENDHDETAAIGGN